MKPTRGREISASCTTASRRDCEKPISATPTAGGDWWKHWRVRPGRFGSPTSSRMAPDLARSTAYRNLEALERCGVVQRLETGGERAYFELAESLLGHHHHLICVSCGAISDIELDSETEARIDDALAAAAHESGFTPVRHNLDLYGRCGDCESDR